jgi:hypothetical protein
MKKLAIIFLGLLATNLLHAGPRDPDATGLRFKSYGEFNKAERSALLTQAQALLKAAFTKGQPKLILDDEGPGSFYNKKNELCEILYAGVISLKDFEKCFDKSKWTIIRAPKCYLSVLHMPAEAVTCFDGQIDGHPAHVLLIGAHEGKSGVAIMVDFKPTKPAGAAAQPAKAAAGGPKQG